MDVHPNGKRLRVLHCPTLVGGNPPQLAKAERKIGLDSWCIAFRQNFLDYECDETLWGPRVSPFRDEFKRWKLLYRAWKLFDVVHFNFGQSILPHRIDPKPGPGSQLRGPLRWGYRAYAGAFWLKDLPLLKRTGKAVFVTYQGDDARQGDFCRAHFPIHFANEVSAGYYTPEGDQRKREEIAMFDRYADGIYAVNPDLLHVLPSRARFIPYATVDLESSRPVGDPPGTRTRPLVIHAPSHREVKGTRYILRAIEKCQADGLSFEFRLVEGLANQEARRLYQQADLVIDQLLAGWYGGLSVEAMAMGKPSVCYIRAEDLKFIDPVMRRDLPIVRATPDSLQSVLKRLLGPERTRLAELGRRSRAYVERWHDPVRVATRLKTDYLTALDQNRESKNVV